MENKKAEETLKGIIEDRMTLQIKDGAKTFWMDYEAYKAHLAWMEQRERELSAYILSGEFMSDLYK